MMKHGLTSMHTGLLAVIALALGWVSTSVAGDQDFTLVNRTGVEIHELYVSPHSADDWEEDVLGQDTLGNGERVKIRFSRSERVALWDLMVVDSEENSITWDKINLLEVSTVTLHYKNGKAWADLE